MPDELRKYVLGFFRPGPLRSAIPPSERPKLLQDHLAYLRTLREAGDLIVYGPVEDPTLAGIVVFATDSIERARELMRAEPKLIRGDLVLDLREWYAAPGLSIVP